MHTPSSTFVTVLLSVFITLHAFLHLFGLIKSKASARLPQLQLTYTKNWGRVWFVSALSFGAAIICLLSGATWSPLLIVAAVMLSQLLIIRFWRDARYGTVANVIILLFAFLVYVEGRFYADFDRDVRSSLDASRAHIQKDHAVTQHLNENPRAGGDDTAVVAQATPNGLLQDQDLRALPAIIQQYIRRSGSLGRPRVHSFATEFSGQLRSSTQSPWMSFESEQVNTLRPLRRHFFVRATMKGLPVAGYHRFEDSRASMDIRVLSLFRVQYQNGPLMDSSETVTFLNDLCFMAPGALIDERLSWQNINDTTVRVTLHNDGIHVSATLYLNTQAELLNFISSDRYASRDDGSMVKAEWLTPAWPVISVNSMKLAGGGDAIYHLPEGELCYGRFSLRSVRYNLELP